MEIIVRCPTCGATAAVLDADNWSEGQVTECRGAGGHTLRLVTEYRYKEVEIFPI